ncbi:MAG: queuosine precursor transporter, partial [Flavobacterium sp.]|nr:queuosine precursor transporter [Flavobacterium sp.]
PVNDDQFFAVFGQSMWIIVGSIIAFLVSQLIDVTIFWFFKNRTGNNKIWLRATGSTIISQLFDSFIVLGIAFWLPGKINFDTFITSALTGYTFKLGIAVLLTPLIYLGHYIIKKYLSEETE